MAYLTKAMETYYGSCSWTYTKKILQVSYHLLGWEHTNCELVSASALEVAKG